MKKAISFLIVLAMFVSITNNLGKTNVIGEMAFRTEISEHLSEDDYECALDGITTEEEQTIKIKLEARNMISSNIDIELLYNEKEEPVFLLGTTSTGYIIIDRKTSECCECGEGNPYREYAEQKKYYGGVFAYYVKNNIKNKNEYYDLLRDESSSSMRTVPLGPDVDEKDKDFLINSPYKSATRYIVDCSYSYIRRRAFGNNKKGTCSAVATCIALNYLKLKHDSKIVSAEDTSEYLSKGIAGDTLYPNARFFHIKMVELYKLQPGAFGILLITPLCSYLTAEVPESSRPTVGSTIFPKFKTIESHIKADKPVIVSTYPSGGPYPKHTMVAYGCRQTSDGENELLVHVGWYSKDLLTKVGGDNYAHKEVWINKKYISYAHYFWLHGE